MPCDPDRALAVERSSVVRRCAARHVKTRAPSSSPGRSGVSGPPMGTLGDAGSVPWTRCGGEYPLGGRMPVQERVDLLHWAADNDVVVLEDDYDSEFRHRRRPLPAMASLPSRADVVLIGSWSKTLTPWLRCGWMVARGPVGERLRAIRAALDTPASGVLQVALAHFPTDGRLARHTARAQRDYGHRRRLVAQALGNRPDGILGALDGGLHVVVHLPPPSTSRPCGTPPQTAAWSSPTWPTTTCAGHRHPVWFSATAPPATWNCARPSPSSRICWTAPAPAGSKASWAPVVRRGHIRCSSALASLPGPDWPGGPHPAGTDCGSAAAPQRPVAVTGRCHAVLARPARPPHRACERRWAIRRSALRRLAGEGHVDELGGAEPSRRRPSRSGRGVVCPRGRGRTNRGAPTRSDSPTERSTAVGRAPEIRPRKGAGDGTSSTLQDRTTATINSTASGPTEESAARCAFSSTSDQPDGWCGAPGGEVQPDTSRPSRRRTATRALGAERNAHSCSSPTNTRTRSATRVTSGDGGPRILEDGVVR